MKTLTEELPSSGSEKSHEHKWQKTGEHDGDNDVYVCTDPNCSESKLVKKPKVVESTGTKQLLCE